VRSPSLSQIAGRQVQLTLPADGTEGPAIDDGGTLDQSETVSAVDLDQLFNTLSPRTIKDFKHVIQGLEISYEGVGPQANRGLKYLNPFLSTSRRVFGELNSDQRAFENLIVDSSKLSGALAARAPDVSALVGNLDAMMNAIGARKERLARAIALLPDFLRRANTTFVNLRAALDDLDPLVDASKPAARELRPFLAVLRQAAADAVPTVRDLDAIVRRPGDDNDLVELTRLQPKLTDRAVGSGSPDCGKGPDNPDDLQVAADDNYNQGAFGESVCALSNGDPTLAFFRAYTPELVGWFDDFGHSGSVDALSGIGRVETTFNAFSVSGPGGGPDLSAPLSSSELAAALDTGNTQRCPGGNERPVTDIDPSDDSVPFTDGGALTDGGPGSCDPTQVQPGP
jgi:phospholipid/cholesterol/gamma-HCH transport system substrate-binding protein